MANRTLRKFFRELVRAFCEDSGVTTAAAKRLAKRRTGKYSPSGYDVRKAKADLERGAFMAETLAKFVPKKVIIFCLALVFIGLVIL